MATVIDTIYEKGVLRPVRPLAMPENMRIRILLPDGLEEHLDDEDQARPWRGLFVPQPMPNDDRIAGFLQPLPLDLIPPESPKISLSWLRNHTDDDE